MRPERHRLFGLTIETTIPLPGLPIAAPSSQVDVSIAYGSLPVPAEPEPIGLHVDGRSAILNISEAGRFLMRDGNTIIVEASSVATERNLRLYLLGSAFGAILHQRRLLPLHANAIDFGGAAIAFMGHSGAGKSTLATWFHDRGHPILSDDVCVVHDDDAGVALVEPGLPRIRLWGDALRASGRTADDYEMSFDDMDKYDVPMAGDARPEPMPLAAIYVLHAAPPEHGGSIVRMTGVNALQALVANTYRGGYVPLMGNVESHLAQCLSLAKRVPVFALQRRWGLDLFAEEAAVVERHVHDVLAG